MRRSGALIDRPASSGPWRNGDLPLTAGALQHVEHRGLLCGVHGQPPAVFDLDPLQAHRVLSRALKVATQRDKWPATSARWLTPRASSGRRFGHCRLRTPAACWRPRELIGTRPDGLSPWPSDSARRGARAYLGCGRPRSGHADRAPGATAVARSGAGLCAAEVSGGPADDRPPGSAAIRPSRASDSPARRAHGGRLPWQDNGLVFFQENGRPIEPRGDHRAWRALLDAKVPQARLHNARAHRSDAAPTAGRARPGGNGDARTLADQPDSRHLLARRSRAGRGRRSTHGRGTVGMSWQPRWHRAAGPNLRLAANPQVNAVGPVGIEPTTRGLKVRCSAS
jgi:hypothetical protein